MLNKVKFPLTNAQLTSFILEKEYTNYFNIQQAISELIDDSFIAVKTIRNSSLYRITESGKETLLFFDNMISAGIKEDIDLYLQENKYDLQQEVSTPAQYFQIKKGEYSVHMKVIEQDTPIIELNLIVPTEDEASLMCNNWKEKSSDIYSYLMASLLDDKL
jgi:DNA-binding PadR family transcriptional regulator